MGDVISSHLDEAKREIITARTREVMGEFGRLYEQQYAVALFNKVRFDIEGGGGPQSQLLQRKIPLENKSIFSGSLFQYLEENKKWRNRFLFVPDSYNINYYDSKASHDRRLQPKGTINCAGYKVLTSLEQYLELISSSLPDVKAKVGSSPFLKCPTQFPLILWHPFAHHYYFCVVTEKEQQKWHAVLQDCVRHTNDGLSEENKVQTPAFTDAVRLYRQAQGHYGTWEMMCGVPSQILSNLVMERLLPELRELISPRLKGKLHERQRNWMLISDAVYSLVQGQCQAQYEAVLQKCEASSSSLEASIRKDMDQIITSKEHVTNKIREVVLPKSEKLLKVSIEPYISSILEALMEPTSRGFSEVRDVFFRELVDMSKNTLNEGTKETVAQHMEKISMLAFHPVKMQSCYEKVEPLSLEGLQQRFDVSSPSVFVQRAQILMREQMDQAVYTFEQILHQSLESQGTEELCKTIQRCQDRVIKKFDYDSSTVRKRFFREALLQIFIPYMLKQLNPSCASELPRFQELIFEDFSRFILVENIFEEVVLHSVMKDIMMAVKEAAVQRRHNLYRDSIVLGNSDPSLHLLGENPSIDWAGEYGGAQEEADGAGEDTEGGGDGEDGESQKRRRMKQVVSMIQVEGSPVLPNESCVEVPGVNDIPEEDGDGDGDGDEHSDGKASTDQKGSVSPKASENPPDLSNGSVLKGDEAKPEEKGKEEVPLKVESATESASAVEEKGEGGDSQPTVEERPSSNQEVSEETLPPTPAPVEIPSGATETAPESLPEATSDLLLPPHDDSGFQSPTSEGAEEEDVAPSTAAPQPSEEHPEVKETSVAVEKAEEDVAPSTAAPPPSEEHPEVKETSVAVEKAEEDVAPSTAAPPPSEEHPEVKETSVAVEKAEEDVAPSTAAPPPSEEHPEVKETSVAVEKAEEDVAPSTVAPPPSEEHLKVRETSVAVEEEKGDVAPSTAAPQPSQHPEVRETSVAVEEEEEGVAPSTAAPQPSEEHPEVKETSAAVEKEEEDVAPITAAPQPSQHPEVKETSAAVEKEEEDVAPITAAPQPSQHPEVKETSVAVEKEEGDVAPITAAPQPSQHPEVKETSVAVEKEEEDVAPSTAAPQPSQHPEVKETSVAVAPSTAAPQSTEHPEVRETSVAAAPETETKPGDQNQ